LPARDAICVVTVKANGELIGTFSTNAVTSQICFSAPPGEYRLKIRSPRAGKTDDDVTVTGEEPGARKTLEYRLK